MDTGLTPWFLSASAFALSMSGTPGPNNVMVAASGANFGFVRTVPHMLGVAVGFAAMMAAMAFGAGGVLRALPILHDALKWLGIAYLLWLAFRIATARPMAAPTASPASSRPLTFLQAALFQWVNPKAWVVGLGGTTAYATADERTVAAHALALAAIFLVATLPCTAFWTLTGVGAARLLHTQRSLRAFNLAMAALLVASLVTLVREG